MRTIHVCKACGSPRVYQDSFAAINSDEVLRYDYTHCMDCDGGAKTEKVEVPDGFDIDVDFYEGSANADR